MALDQDIINEQLTQLAAHRRTLAHLLEQAAQYGGEVLAPPQTANGIAEARSQIARIKATLREGSVKVDDDPNDEAPPQVEPARPSPAGGDVVMGDRVGGDKVMGDKHVHIVQPVLAPALHQLRAPVADFVGREQQIDQLVAALTRGGSTAISGIHGMGGIGKSELAYVVANQLTSAFPDAQIVIHLRGASTSPLSPEQTLQTVIRAFSARVKLPDGLAELKTLYAALLAGTRTIILADDAKDSAQVRPLLPPSGCALLITSRNRFNLPGMAAINLETLPPEEAEKLLLEICPRIGEHAGELARLCGYLPLALRVSASLLKTNESRDVPFYLKQLETERLKHLSDPDYPDDPEASVEASLKLSYDALEPAAQRALCQMSVFPTSFWRQAAEVVVVIDSDVVDALELLIRRNFVNWNDSVKRYELHDLVREFAAARLEDADTARYRHAHYFLSVANHAENNLYLKGDAATGLALFDQERIHIDAGWEWARAHAGDPDADALSVSYADVTANIGELRYDARHERILQFEAALEIARRRGDRHREGTVLNNLGGVYRVLKEPKKALEIFTQRLTIARELGDRKSEGNALGNLGNTYGDLKEPQKAVNCYLQALSLMREERDWRGEAIILGNLASVYRESRQAKDVL